MAHNNLPVNKDEGFIAECETMNLAELKDRLYLVAVSTGQRSESKFVSTTARGPYSFVEMVEEVGTMWNNEQHHARVVVLEKDRTKPIKTLDENTTDYIECHYTDIVTEAMLDGVFDDVKEYTCRAGIVEAEPDADIRSAKKEEKIEDKGTM